MCNAEPLDCQTFQSSQCLVSFVKNYCPRLCGPCVTTTKATTSTTTTSTTTTTTTTTTTPTTSTTTTPTTSTTTCAPITCLNGGTYVPSSCSCTCLPAWSGNQCQTVMCNMEPVDCQSFQSAQCVVSFVKSLCPVGLTN